MDYFLCIISNIDSLCACALCSHQKKKVNPFFYIFIFVLFYVECFELLWHFILDWLLLLLFLLLYIPFSFYSYEVYVRSTQKSNNSMNFITYIIMSFSFSLSLLPLDLFSCFFPSVCDSM